VPSTKGGVTKANGMSTAAEMLGKRVLAVALASAGGGGAEGEPLLSPPPSSSPSTAMPISTAARKMAIVASTHPDSTANPDEQTSHKAEQAIFDEQARREERRRNLLSNLSRYAK
jgi:hypothetical protein